VARRWREWLPLGVLFAATLILFHRLLFGQVIYWGVVSIQFYPWRDAAFGMLREGVLPLWNPAVGNGAPLLANLQTAVFYPPNWLYLIIPTEYAMGIVGVGHVLWAGLGMWMYLGRIGLDRLAKGIGVIAFALGGYLIGRFGFLSVVSAVLWLPWIIWAVDRLVARHEDDPGVYRSAAVLGLFVGLQLLAGHAQTSFYTLVFAGIYSVWLATTRAPTRGAPTKVHIEGLAAALIAVVVGVGLAGVQLFPTFELMEVSSRAGGANIEEALAYSFWPWRVLTLFAPNLFGSPVTGDYWGYATYWEDAVFVGVMTILLALIAVVKWARRRLDDELTAVRYLPFFVWIIPPAFLLAMGRFTPVFPFLFKHVPTFDLFRGPTRWMLLVVFSVCVLASVGAHGWATNRRVEKQAGYGITVGLAILIAGGASLVILKDIIDPTFVRAAFRLGVTLVIVSVLPLVLKAHQRDTQRRYIWELLVLVVLAADLVSAHWGLNPTIDADFYRNEVDLAPEIEAALDGTRLLYDPAAEMTIKFDELFTFEDFHSGDDVHWQRFRDSLLPNYAQVVGFNSANNDDPLALVEHAELVSEAAESLEVARQANVGVILTTEERNDLEYLGMAGLVRAYHVDDTWSRFEVAGCGRVGQDFECERALEIGRLEVVEDSPLRIVVRLEMDEAGWLYVADSYYPNWKSKLDGHNGTTYRANDYFRAVEVPAGSHEIEMRYDTSTLVAGAFTSGVSLILLVGAYFIPFTRRQVDNV